MSDYSLVTDKAALAFQAYLDANRTADLPNTFAIRVGEEPDARQTPCAIIYARAAPERIKGRGVYDVELVIDVISQADERDPSLHRARAGAVVAILNDIRGVCTALNRPQVGGDARTQKDFNCFNYFLINFEPEVEDRKYTARITLQVTCQGMDI